MLRCASSGVLRGGALRSLLYIGMDVSQPFAVLLRVQKDAADWADIVSALQSCLRDRVFWKGGHRLHL